VFGYLSSPLVALSVGLGNRALRLVEPVASSRKLADFNCTKEARGCRSWAPQWPEQPRSDQHWNVSGGKPEHASYLKHIDSTQLGHGRVHRGSIHALCHL
jgi:hypothetical protein